MSIIYLVLHYPWKMRITIHGSEVGRIKIRMHSSRMRTVRSSSRLLLGGGFCLGGSARGGLSAQGRCQPGGCLPKGVCVSQHALGQTPSPPNRMTDTCKNITLPQLRLRTVISHRFHISQPPLPGHSIRNCR